MNYIITGNTYNGKYAQNPEAGITVLSAEELSQSKLRFSPRDKVYVPSETSLSLVMDRLDDSTTVAGIRILKDKYLCREALSGLFPDFYFAKCDLDAIKDLKITDKKLVIKPRKGFFGTGVRFADMNTDLIKLTTEIRAEVAAYSRFFPESILSAAEYVIEELIQGEEYAVDMYFDAAGKAEIMNIYHHPVPLNPEYAHLMYYSNSKLFDEHLQAFTQFFDSFGAILNLKNFPLHAEFKLINGGFIPIEFNPMRYGGFGLADLAFNSYGFHPIAAYYSGNAVDWSDVWSTRAELSYAFILAYNGKDVDLGSMQPDHVKFRAYLQERVEIMDYVTLDFKHNPVFAIAYVKSSDGDKLNSLLATEFSDFFV